MPHTATNSSRSGCGCLLPFPRSHTAPSATASAEAEQEGKGQAKADSRCVVRGACVRGHRAVLIEPSTSSALILPMSTPHCYETISLCTTSYWQETLTFTHILAHY
jgi:hypothetical protein